MKYDLATAKEVLKWKIATASSSTVNNIYLNSNNELYCNVPKATDTVSGTVLTKTSTSTTTGIYTNNNMLTLLPANKGVLGGVYLSKGYTSGSTTTYYNSGKQYVQVDSTVSDGIYVDLSNYYTKTETDTKFANYYTKDEIGDLTKDLASLFELKLNS